MLCIHIQYEVRKRQLLLGYLQIILLKSGDEQSKKLHGTVVCNKFLLIQRRMQVVTYQQIRKKVYNII